MKGNRLLLIVVLCLSIMPPYHAEARYYDARVGRWMSVDPLAEKYPRWSPYSYTMCSPVVLFDPNGREVRNSHQYVLSNNSLVSSVIRFNSEVARITGKNTKDYVFVVTGGDRYKDELNGVEVHRSRTNNSIVPNSDKHSPHLEENGARGIDMTYAKGVAWGDIEKAAAGTGFSQAINRYTDGHFHLTLDWRNSTGETTPGNAPSFDETKDIQRTQAKQVEHQEASLWQRVERAVAGFVKSVKNTWNQVTDMRK
jgi:hypothetical protein